MLGQIKSQEIRILQIDASGHASIGTYLLRQIMSADVEGSWAGFFEAFGAEPFVAGGLGATEGLLLLVPLAAVSSDCAPFFLRAMTICAVYERIAMRRED